MFRGGRLAGRSEFSQADAMAFSASHPSRLFPESDLRTPSRHVGSDRSLHVGGRRILSSFFLLSKGQRDVPTYACLRVRGWRSYRPEHGII